MSAGTRLRYWKKELSGASWNVSFDELKQGIRDIEFLADPTVGEVRIGCPESMTAGIVPAILDRVSRHNPHVVVHVVNAQTGISRTEGAPSRSDDGGPPSSSCKR